MTTPTHPLANAASPVRVFESQACPADRAVVALLEDQLAGADLAGPAVALPDLYRKPVMESPSSIAVATRDTIRPTLTSAALNCGMALAAIDVGRPGLAEVRRFLDSVRAAYPFPPGWRRVLSPDEVIGCASGGAVFASEMAGLDPRECARIEEGGRIAVEPYGGAARVRRELGRMATQLSRLRFGTIGPNTHFVELQEVEDVFEPETARRLGVERGQVTLQYHGGDGVLNIQMGARFGRRLAGSRSLRAVMAVQKPLYQLASARSAAQLRRRARLYFGDGCPPVPREGEEGERLMLSVAMAMNYGFAYRRATFATLGELARRHLGGPPRLVFDSPHNTIYEEAVDGTTCVVHRHNAARALPPGRLLGHPVFASTGQPVLLPGTNRTCSYLCVADEGAVHSLCSANHGTGSIIADFVRRGRSGPDPGGRATLRVRYGGRGDELVPQLDNAGVDEGLRILVAHRIVRPVARLRPFAGLT